jgi:hypothetical protein
MPILVCVDRIEGDLAVLEAADQASFTLPRSLLPPEAGEGTWLRLSLDVDPEETARARASVASLRADLVDDGEEDFAL